MLWITLGNPLLSIVAVLIIFRLLDEADFFKAIARYIAFSGQGDGQRLFSGMVFLAGITAVLFNNYISILLWTPVFMEILQVLRFRPKPTLAYVLTISLIAETASLICLTSNPINWLTTQYWDISILRYTLVMLPVTVAVVSTTLIILRFYFDRYLPPYYALTLIQNTVVKVNDPLLCRWGIGIICLLLMASILPQFSGLITSVTAIITLAIAKRWFNKGYSKLSLAKTIPKIPWYAVIFTLAMSGVGIGLGKIGLISGLAMMFQSLSHWGVTLATLAMGLLAMISSVFIHNFPTIINSTVGLHQETVANQTLEEAMIYANLMGCSLGAKIMPMGSLSNLLWLDIVQQKGLILNWQQYFRLHLVLLIPSLLIGLLSLVLWIPWIVA